MKINNNPPAPFCFSLIKRKLRNYIICKPLVIVLLLLLPMGCMLTREKYFHYSILSKIPENYVIEIEYQEHSDVHKQSDWKEQTKNKALVAAKFALQKHDISCNRFFVSDIISTMHDGVYVSVYAGNWGDGYSNYDEIRHEMIKAYEKRKNEKIRPRISIAHGKAPLQRLNLPTISKTLERTDH